MDIPEKDQPVARTGKINLKYDGSDLYDSFELREITYQLNKAIQGSNASSPSYPLNLNSPFYRHQLNRIYREGAKTTKRISHQQIPDKSACRSGTAVAGFATRLWMKVKQGLQGHKQDSDEKKPTPANILKGSR
ncbi:hypothetical protein L6164_014518 [Bauhinia variegata]|uniref:Uncharacterized protein n=1 Tax=Bauhinia variegata TaxID=167791 RepID=A0ACB9NHL4_BAUVA|nr:hypothetical protein L6164_014518 [Bauhinia variegata]